MVPILGFLKVVFLHQIVAMQKLYKYWKLEYNRTTFL